MSSIFHSPEVAHAVEATSDLDMLAKSDPKLRAMMDKVDALFEQMDEHLKAKSASTLKKAGKAVSETASKAFKGFTAFLDPKPSKTPDRRSKRR